MATITANSHALAGFGLFWRVCLLLAFALLSGGLASWCVAVVPFLGMRKLRPRVELHSFWEKARALATEQKRHVHLGLGDEACVMSSVPWWNGETAVLQVERANRR